MTQPSQANILAALTAQSSSLRSRPPPTTQLWADIADPKTALTDPAPASKTSSEKAGPSTPRENKTRLYCIREACGSLILLPNVAEYIESSGPIVRPIPLFKPSNQAKTDQSSSHPTKTPLSPNPPATPQYPYGISRALQCHSKISVSRAQLRLRRYPRQHLEWVRRKEEVG